MTPEKAIQIGRDIFLCGGIASRKNLSLLQVPFALMPAALDEYVRMQEKIIKIAGSTPKLNENNVWDRRKT